MFRVQNNIKLGRSDVLRKRFVITLIALLFVSFLFPLSAQQKVVTLASLDWEPYIGQNLPGNGYCAQIATEAFKRSGYTVKISFLPWERAVQESKAGHYDGLFPEYYDTGRKADYVYSDSFPGGPVGFMKRKDKAITFKGLQDLKPYTIGIVRGYVNTAEFDAASYLKKDASESDDINLQKLYSKRLDLIFIDKYVGQYLMKTKFPTYLGEIEFINPPLEEKPLYIVFSKKGNDTEAKRKAFNDGLKSMQSDGTLKKIVGGAGK